MRLPVLAFLAASFLSAQTGDPWKRLDFLVGDWKGIAGEKDTPLGAGQGDFSFHAELNKKIIVRRNNATYDSGAQHDDLMVIYLDAPEEAPRAIYFDSEGHVIRYRATFPAEQRVVFESDASQPGPRYRLTYWMEGGALNGRFEIAAPQNGYKNYLSWKSTRR